MEKSVCFSGHRDDRLPDGGALYALEQKIYTEIARAVCDGYTRFIHGGCRGFDILAAKQVIRFRDCMGAKITLLAAIPFPQQSPGRTPKQRADYEYVIKNSDVREILFDHYEARFFLERNRWMCEHSSRLICYFDGVVRSGTGNTVRTAQSLGLEIVNLYEEPA